MADIEIQRKSGVGWWWWVLGLLILLLAGWAIAEMLGGDDEAEQVAVVDGAYPVDTAGAAAAGAAADPSVTVGTAEVSGPVQQYLATCAPQQAQQMAMDHQYTSNCIDRLVASIEAMLQGPGLQGVNVQSQVQDARQKADQLRQSANESTRHAGMTREALVSAGTALQAIQSQRYPGLSSQVAQLQEAAQQITESRPLLEQRDVIQRYFQLAGEALNGMSAGSPTSG